ncbi:MAG: hypothetical protein J5713_02205 [Clostridia bacterium]|nr:hypothetical protein [Clostridia bacterium]
MAQGRKSKISRQGAIYRVALAGISAALALLLVWLSVLARYGTLGFFAAAGIVLMIPLAKKYYLSAFFAYAVSAGLSVLVGDLASVMGYILYFGPIALAVGIVLNKNIKWFVALPIVAAYTVGMLALLYYVFHSVILAYEVLEGVKFWMFALVGTPVLLVIDAVLYVAYLKIVPRIANVLRDDENNKNRQSNPVNSDDDSPFEEEFETYIKPVEKKDEENEDEKN